ncbi:hypothetical protein RCL_jg13902.t1 [Rhizophagus clarus]|uniref:Uncharacterized protein n=1 Tax=Rhizophagus clarus TaxID=94130 RepID=A0A8H3QU96_9GLOM|nr:hypothetical protein RCL_jg13902.t1 [Rhizophagus clarus]
MRSYLYPLSFVSVSSFQSPFHQIKHFSNCKFIFLGYVCFVGSLVNVLFNFSLPTGNSKRSSDTHKNIQDLTTINEYFGSLESWNFGGWSGRVGLDDFGYSNIYGCDTSIFDTSFVRWEPFKKKIFLNETFMTRKVSVDFSKILV